MLSIWIGVCCRTRHIDSESKIEINLQILTNLLNTQNALQAVVLDLIWL